MSKRFRPILERLEQLRLLTAVPIFSTGVVAAGQPSPMGQPDPHFALISAPSGVCCANAYVLNSLPQGYVANSPTSQWIGPAANPFDLQDSGDYDYRTTFDLSGFDPSSVVLNLGLASDNDSRIFLNGADTGIALTEPSDGAPDDYDALHPFTISSGFLPGLNTLDLKVHNVYSVTGVRLDGERPGQRQRPADAGPRVGQFDERGDECRGNRSGGRQPHLRR